MSDTEIDPSVARSTALMSVATLASRITGLLRTWAMAFALGNTLVTSAFQVANNLPNVIFELVAGGLLGAAFIPIYTMCQEESGKEGGHAFGRNVLNILVLILGILSVLASIFAPYIVDTQTFTVGRDAAVTEYAVIFFRIFAFQILFYGISGVVNAMLNANRVYFLPALAPAMNNVITIIAFFSYVPLSEINPMLALIVLGVGVTLGVVVQAVVQIPALKKIGFTWSWHIDWHDPALIEALKIAVPTMIYILGTFVSYTFRNAFSLQTGDDGPSTLLYAWVWFQLPYGVFAVSVSRTMFTEMSVSYAQKNSQKFRDQVKRGISATLLMISPLAILLIVCSSSIMSLFHAGKFGEDDVYYVARILSVWALALPFYSVHMYLYNTFASIRKFHLFAAVSCVMVILQCFLYSRFATTELFGLAGIPIADFCYYGACCLIEAFILYKIIGSIGVAGILKKTALILVSSVVGGLIAFFVLGLIPNENASILSGFIELIVAGGIGLVVIYSLCAAFRLPEMSFVKSILKKIGAKFGIGKGESDTED